MILFITGTPGTGKTTTSQLLASQLSVPLIVLNQLVEDEHLYTGIHPQWGFKIVDLDALCSKLQEIILDLDDEQDLIIVEGHLSHFCKEADVVVVLRTNPPILRERLNKRGFEPDKIQENVEAEALDIITYEAYQIHGDKVNEIHTHGKNPQEVVQLIRKVINGEKHFPVGKTDYLEHWI